MGEEQQQAQSSTPRKRPKRRRRRAAGRGEGESSVEVHGASPQAASPPAPAAPAASYGASSHGASSQGAHHPHQPAAKRRQRPAHASQGQGQGQPSSYHHGYDEPAPRRPLPKQDEYKIKTPKEKFGGREPIVAREDMELTAWRLTPFDLFCAYHLGITEDNGYSKPVARDCARRLRVSIDEMHDALRDFGLDNKSLDEYDFDLSMARLDIRVAPEGIDRREIAKVHFDELLELNPSLRERLARRSETAHEDELSA